MAKDKQLTAQVNEGNELVLIESRTMRDNFVYRDDVLEKVKAISMIGEQFEVTIEMASDYYEVPIETVRSIVKRHRAEFNDYEELRLLKGKALQEFKALVHGEPDLSSAPSLQLLNRRGLLRLGMLLTESEVARLVRNYLLNVEDVSTEAQKRWAVEREISKRERRRLTDSIQQYFTGELHINEYAAFTNLVYATLFDSTAAELKELYGLEKKDQLRDNLTTEDLRKVVDVETVMASLLRLGRSYEEIKVEMVSNKESFR
ncbi:hypothetical protein [Lysinibacillus fusiformis]|uniref:Uncharacterized protein n=1 Tax=Lysinibacillus fusiformis TaxID=28031 RepID=A0A1E4R4S7_9BACI|nr:hypothetical protein [Lysinibacillus fusiformis]MDC6268026.1 hypothetical protein [Lysinibacillus sphaericus]MDN4967484.1 hypothetical protein [Lysinibacillus fusiformis]ODV55453.1 hypothetical protein BG258_05815 [Lysinibacillus fusiformis]